MKRTLTFAVAVCSALVVSVSAATATSFRASSAALRPSLPTGWVEVAYKNAQVAVPRSFSVVYPNEQFCSPFPSTGTIFLGAVALSQVCLENQPPVAQVTLVYMRSQYFSPGSLQGYKSILKDGLRLYLVTVNGARGYYSPVLGMEVAANGPDALGVLSTFALSPRWDVLATGLAPQVPSSWRRVSFDGVSFSVPSDWTVKRSIYAMGIGQLCSMPGVALGGADSVVLSTDKRLYVVPCPLIGQWPQLPVDGVQIDGGPDAPSVTASSQCLSLKALRACLAGGASYRYSILVLKVVVPGRSMPVTVSIGLAGNGMVARTILYSLQSGARTVLSGDGVGPMQFGDSESATVSALTNLFGAQGVLQKYHDVENCGLDSALVWSGAKAVFNKGRFVGYAISAPPSRLGAATAKGLQVGDTLGKARQLYGGTLRTSGEQDGAWFVKTPQGTLDGFLTGEPTILGANDQIASIDAGVVGCPAMSP